MEELLEKIRRLKEKVQPICSTCGIRIGEKSSIAMVDVINNKLYCGNCYQQEYDLL